MNKKLKLKIHESLSAVIPITLIVLALGMTVVPMELSTLMLFLAGAALLILGMGFFTLGADMAMMPIGERVGAKLTSSGRLPLIALACFIIGAVILIPVLAFIALGDGSIAEGIRLFATSSPEHLNAIQPANAQPPYIPWPMIVLGCGINHISYWCTNQSIMQRVLGAKNLKEAQKGSLLTGLTCVFCPIFLVAPGVIQFIRDGGVLTDFDMAYPSLIKDILPTPVLGFFAAVMFGAILSSFNSVLNSSMTLFTLDILPVISKRKRTDAQLITIAKRFGIVLCLASIIIAPFLLYLPAGISTFLNQMWGYYGVPVLAIVVMGILAPRMPSFAPKVAIIVHIVCYGLMMNLLPFHFLYFEVGAFVIDLILMAILTKAAPRKEAYVLPDLEVVDMTPWKYRKPVIAVTFILLAGIYVLFSPLGLGG